MLFVAGSEAGAGRIYWLCGGWVGDGGKEGKDEANLSLLDTWNVCQNRIHPPSSLESWMFPCYRGKDCYDGGVVGWIGWVGGPQGCEECEGGVRRKGPSFPRYRSGYEDFWVLMLTAV